MKPFRRLLASAFNLFTDRSSYRPAGCNNILMLLLHLCDMDEQLQQWVLRWLAYPLRNPGARMSTAIVINGPTGIGINTFFEGVACQLHDTHHVIAARQMHYHLFGASWARAKLVVVKGRFNVGSHRMRLKELMSADSLIVERSDRTPCTVPNELNFVFTSRYPDLLPEHCADKQFIIIEAPPARQASFYDAIEHEIDHGGVHEFLEYLRRDLDMGDFNADTLPPKASAHKQQEAA